MLNNTSTDAVRRAGGRRFVAQAIESKPVAENWALEVYAAPQGDTQFVGDFRATGSAVVFE